MSAFEELEHLIETLDPPGAAAMSRARRLILRATSQVTDSFELAGAIYAFEVAFDALAETHDFDADTELEYERALARQRLRALRGVAKRTGPRLN